MNNMRSQPNTKDKSNSFDWGMHYLRAFAIVCILLDHLWCYTGFLKESHAFLVGSTIYFLFISGYLCQYLSTKRSVPAKTYYWRKVTNVLCPYLVWTLLTIIVIRVTNETRLGVISPSVISWKTIPKIMALGWAQGPYWYIPFVCVLFLVSPRLLLLSNSDLIRLFILSFALAICLPVRPVIPIENNLASLVMQYTYFAWSYLLGFLYARFKKQIDSHLNEYCGISLILGLLLGLQTMLPDYFTFGYPSSDALEPHTKSFVLAGSLAQSIQKLFFLVPSIALANRLSDKRISVLDWLATYSFTLYFSHHFFVQDFVQLQERLFTALKPGPLGVLPIQLVLSVLFIAFNLILAMALKRLFGRWSRWFIGS